MSDIPAFGTVIYAKDCRALADFYAQVTGLTLREAEGDYVMLESPSFFLVVLQIPKRIADTMTIEKPPRRRENTPVKLILGVESIERARQAVVALGGDLNDPSREWSFHGLKRCDGVDPEGNIFQLQEINHL